MKALVYEAPYQMSVRDVPEPAPQPDEVLIRVAFSGICGSELSGYEGKNALRKPPLIMGHEFSGTIEAIGDYAAQQFPNLSVGQAVAVNPLISCRQCDYCLSGRQHLCPKRKLLSAHLPGSNAELVAVRSDAVHLLPDGMALPLGALAEPTACGVHAVKLVRPQPSDTVLVVGAGPIGLFIVQALAERGVKTIFCADLNAERLAMAEASGAIPLAQGVYPDNECDIGIEAVGLTATRQICSNAVKPGGSIVWVGLHEQFTPLDINGLVRREITCYGSFGYTPLDYEHALHGLAGGRFWLEDTWTRVEPLERGAACFDELLHGSPMAKIWLTSQS
jgi:threonine dehydrogenase-like Zn-dependent dehydrogenase